MAAFCTGCVKDKHLKKMILDRGAIVEKCAICSTERAAALDADDKALKTLIRALIRYNYAEFAYNTHFGGDELWELFVQENPITAYDDSWSLNDYEEAVYPSIESGCESDHAGISLFAGYDTEGRQNMLLSALKDDMDWSLLRLKNRLKETNYFLLDSEAAAFLKPHLQKLERILPNMTTCYRARVGVADTLMPMFGSGEQRHFRPYVGAQLGAPPPPMATAGRLNRVGVALLYVATDIETALSEVRPHPGDLMSIGQFSSARALRIADFNEISIADYAISDESIDQYLVLKSIDDLFSQPVTPSERHKYGFTQFLSDVIRHLGFDGIGYKSSVGDGTNLALFDPSAFTFVAGSAKSIRITALRYTHKDLPEPQPGKDYMVRRDGKYVEEVESDERN
jgi:hypothetical protein